MHHLGSVVRWPPHSMTNTAGEFRIATLFAVLEAEEPKSFWYRVDVVGRAIEYLPNTGRHPIPFQHGPRASTPHPGAALCRRPFHRDSAAGGRLSGGEGRDLTILDLVDEGT
jgi:hypothetical protein